MNSPKSPDTSEHSVACISGTTFPRLKEGRRAKTAKPNSQILKIHLLYSTHINISILHLQCTNKAKQTKKNDQFQFQFQLSIRVAWFATNWKRTRKKKPSQALGDLHRLHALQAEADQQRDSTGSQHIGRRGDTGPCSSATMTRDKNDDRKIPSTPLLTPLEHYIHVEGENCSNLEIGGKKM